MCPILFKISRNKLGFFFFSFLFCQTQKSDIESVGENNTPELEEIYTLATRNPVNNLTRRRNGRILVPPSRCNFDSHQIASKLVEHVNRDIRTSNPNYESQSFFSTKLLHFQVWCERPTGSAGNTENVTSDIRGQHSLFPTDYKKVEVRKNAVKTNARNQNKKVQNTVFQTAYWTCKLYNVRRHPTGELKNILKLALALAVFSIAATNLKIINSTLGRVKPGYSEPVFSWAAQKTAGLLPLAGVLTGPIPIS